MKKIELTAAVVIALLFTASAWAQSNPRDNVTSTT
jgi:hypothetical protein